MLPDAQYFEELRSLPSPTVALLLLGTEAEWNKRAQFAQDFLLSAGIPCTRHLEEDFYKEMPSCTFLVFCGKDAQYEIALPKIQKISSSKIILVTAASTLPVWALCHASCNRLSILKRMLSEDV